MLPADIAPPKEEAENRARRHVEMLVQRNRQDTGIGFAQVAPDRVRSVAVIGAGMMGTAIAAAAVKQGLPVVITDADPDVLAAAPQRIAAELVEQGESPDAKTLETVRRLVQPTTDDRRIAGCDLILESVAETLAVKQGVYSRLAPLLSPRTVLASNTSTIPIGRLAAELPERDRFCGIHFFHPVRHRSLVEVVRGPQTSDQTVATAVTFAKQIEKMPIVVDDGPGFFVNRLLFPYLSEALELLLDGAKIDDVERAATGFGMAIGPLRICDEIGLDTVLLAGRVLWEAFPDRVVASPLLVTMVKSGRLGRKSGAGFFTYPSQVAWAGSPGADPQVDPIIAQWARPPQPLTPETITARLLLPMVLEASRVLEERKVRDARDIDLGVIFGLGFPASRGGLLYWADTLGAQRIVEMLRPMEALGGRAQPTPLLLELAAQNRRFYD